MYLNPFCQLVKLIMDSGLEIANFAQVQRNLRTFENYTKLYPWFSDDFSRNRN